MIINLQLILLVKLNSKLGGSVYVLQSTDSEWKQTVITEDIVTVVFKVNSSVQSSQTLQIMVTYLIIYYIVLHWFDCCGYCVTRAYTHDLPRHNTNTYL